MSPDGCTAPEHAQKLLGLISLELAFLDPHGNAPAASVRDLVVEWTQAVAASGSATLDDLAGEARSIVEAMPGVAAVLNSDAIARLHDWHPRAEEAVIAWRRAPGGEIAAAAAAAIVVSEPRRAQAVEVDGSTQLYAVLPADADEELARLFCAEAQDLLADIEQGVLVLEQRPQDQETLATVFRAFHTFKGNASVMKLAVVQRLAHELESLLDAARRGTHHLGRRSIDAVLAGADVFRRFVTEMSAQVDGHHAGRQIPLPVDALTRDVQRILAAGEAAEEGAPAAPPGVSSPVQAAATGPVPGMPAATATVPPASASALPSPAPAPPAAAGEPPGAAPAAPAATGGLIRVDTAKLDGLIDLVGELVIAQSMVMQHSQADAVAGEQFARSLRQLRGISAELQRSALSLRMVPIRGAFQKMARLVRDLSGQVGKEIRLEIEGEETELDRTLVEELGDPLVHMIRNAADHGIEPPAARVAAGKPPQGTIRLRAFHKGGMVVIEVRDDGRGLDPVRLRVKAVERGLVSAQEPLSERETLELVFAPGLSTAASVTDLSGRGVGMDVVRRNIERLRGTIDIESAVGSGTTFTIALPLTLAIIEGLLVQVGAERFVVPTLSVRESFRPLPHMLSFVQGRGEMVSVRGRLVPLLRLADHLRIPAAVTDPTRGIVMVLEAGQDHRCLLVDALVGKQEVVVKTLGETFREQQDFAGAAILGDGRVGLVLDTTALVRLKTKHTEAA